MYRIIIIVIVFLAGLIFCMTGKKENLKEGFVTEKNCPNVLLQAGNEILLYNQNKATIPGVNPIRFNNLDEYVEFTQWQRRVGIRCPVLYLQQTYDAQNNLGWRLLNNPLYPKAGMLTSLPATQRIQETLLYDANRLDPPYNQGDYPAFDPDNQYIGDYTPLDKMFHQPGVSNNPMDAGYVPPIFLDQGYYLQNNRESLLRPPQPIVYGNQNGYIFDNFNQYGGDTSDGQQNGSQGESMSQYTQAKNAETIYGQQNGQQPSSNQQYSSMGQYTQAQDNAAMYGQQNGQQPSSNQQYSSMGQYTQAQDNAAMYGQQNGQQPSSNQQYSSMGQYTQAQDNAAIYGQSNGSQNGSTMPQNGSVPPQYSSMAQYVQQRTNLPDSPMENIPYTQNGNNQQYSSMGQYTQAQDNAAIYGQQNGQQATGNQPYSSMGQYTQSQENTAISQSQYSNTNNTTTS